MDGSALKITSPLCGVIQSGYMSMYGLIVGGAVAVWWSWVERIEPRAKKVVPWVIVAALIGARVYHVIDQWDYYAQDWGRILQVWNGGLSIWGGVGAGLLVLWLGIRKEELENRRAIIAAFITPLPLAQAIGRLANGFNGEFTNLVGGIPWWAMEAILDLALFGIVWLVEKKWRIWVYAGGYLLIRLVLQPYR